MELVKGKIYKIVADDTTNIYIGSTVQKLNARFRCHKSHKNTHAIKLFTYPNIRIELIEEYNCNSMNELRQREQYYINLNKDICINPNKAYITKEECIIRNKTKYKQQRKQYYEDNKDTIAIKKKIYAENNKEKECIRKKEWGDKIVICDCGASVSRQCLSKHKKRNIHIELLNEKTKI